MNTSNTTHQNPITRRRWGQWALAATAGFGLAACGGGGGGSDEPPTLREAFDRLQNGMTKRQVRELVGREPFANTGAALDFRSGDESLYTTFYTDSSKSSEDYEIISAMWTTTSGQKINRRFA